MTAGIALTVPSAQADGPAPNFVERLTDFESPWGSLSERAQDDFTEGARRAVSTVVGGFVWGVTTPFLGEEARSAGIGAGLVTTSLLRATGADQTIARSAVTVAAATHEGIAVDTEIRRIQAEWKINAVRSAARTVRDAAAEVAEIVVETAVETVDRATRRGPGRVIRNCVRAMFSTRGC